MAQNPCFALLWVLLLIFIAWPVAGLASGRYMTQSVVLGSCLLGCCCGGSSRPSPYLLAVMLSHTSFFFHSLLPPTTLWTNCRPLDLLAALWGVFRLHCRLQRLLGRVHDVAAQGGRIHCQLQLLVPPTVKSRGALSPWAAARRGKPI